LPSSGSGDRTAVSILTVVNRDANIEPNARRASYVAAVDEGVLTKAAASKADVCMTAELQPVPRQAASPSAEISSDDDGPEDEGAAPSAPSAPGGPPATVPRPPRPGASKSKPPPARQGVKPAAESRRPAAGGKNSADSGGIGRKSALAQITPGDGNDRLTLHIQNADLRDVLELLSEKGNLNILAGNAVEGKVSATLHNVDIDGALRAILRSTGFVARREGKFIFVGKPEEFEQIEQSLDKVSLRVYRPNYVAAAELQALIQPLLTAKIGQVSVSAPAEMGIAADSDKAGGNKFAGGEAVVIRDYEAVLSQVDQLVKEVDVRPAQVAIEAMILSVKLNDTDTTGINWQFLRQNPNIAFALGTPPAALPTPGNFAGGLTFAFLDSNLGAFVQALETINETNVIATPRLMVINKQKAQIQIGRKQGYIAGTIQTETSTTQNMEMLETGTMLRIRPFISSDGLVRMELHPELSTGEVTVLNNTLVPDTEVTQVTTNVMVRDGCTVIIGGLMQDSLSTSGDRVPVLGCLPVLGALFRNNTETIQRYEILVLITPRIVYEPETCQEGEHAACEFHRGHAVYADEMSSCGRRWIGRRYFRLAQSAWADGDGARAMRFVELAVTFDPLNRAAIDLRSTICAGQPVGEHTLRPPCGPAGATAPLDGPQIAPWVLNDLAREAGAKPNRLHPLDRGEPGEQITIKRPRVLE
jgi:type IV pilus assembly protein PilQ